MGLCMIHRCPPAVPYRASYCDALASQLADPSSLQKAMRGAAARGTGTTAPFRCSHRVGLHTYSESGPRQLTKQPHAPEVFTKLQARLYSRIGLNASGDAREVVNDAT